MRVTSSLAHATARALTSDGSTSLLGYVVGDVDLNERRVAAGVLDDVDRVVAGLGYHVRDDDVRALRSETFGRCASDTRSSTRYHRRLAADTVHDRY